MGFDLGLIIALALAASANLSDFLRIPEKLRGWIAMLLIVSLYMVNQWLYAPAFDWKTAFLQGGTAALAAVGIHSTAKNTMQQFTLFRGQRGKTGRQRTETIRETSGGSIGSTSGMGATGSGMPSMIDEAAPAALEEEPLSAEQRV